MTTVTRALHLTDEGAQAADVRRFYAHMFGDSVGVFGTDLAVTEKSGTPDMSVDVADGFALCAGTESASQGSYIVENDGVQNVSIAAADPTNDRHDLICAYVTDTDEGAGTSTAIIGATTGTPAASPSDPTAPDNSVVLARVVVPNAASSITNSDITDLRFTTTGQTRVGTITSERIVGYDTSNDATTLNPGYTSVAGLSVTFTAHDGYAYEVIWDSGDWNHTAADTFVTFRATGMPTTNYFASVEFTGNVGWDQQWTSSTLFDSLTAGTSYTVGVEGLVRFTGSSQTVTKGSGWAGKLWVREILKGY